MTTDHPPRTQAVGIGPFSPPTHRQGRRSLDRPCPPAPKLIGVVVDGTASGRDAVVLASLLGQGSDAELMLIDIVEESLVLLDGASAHVQVSPGNPTEELRALAAEVDLLVIGSSRSDRASRLSLGRTGRLLGAGSPCSIMIVPRPRDDSAL